jgi:RNA polymerase sigma-70 factor (ECF subfamily)
VNDGQNEIELVNKFFEQIVAEHKDKVYNTCLGFVKNEADAEDLAQEVFIEVFKGLGKFRKEANVFTWIYRIAVNKSLGHIRKTKSMKCAGDMVLLDAELNKSDDTFYHPGVLLENRENAARLMKAIDSLPEQQNVAFVLSKIEGLSYQQIGLVMDKSISSIESILHRAKMNLRKELRTYYEEV